MSELDSALFFAINNGLSTPWLDGVMTFFTVAGDLSCLIAFGVLFILLWDTPNAKRRLIAFGLAVAVSGLAGTIIKVGVGRDRPLEAYKEAIDDKRVTINVPYHFLVARSFPSGHTQGAFTVAMFFVLYYRRRVGLLLAGAMLVGVSRIYLGVHYPLDVVAGAALGSAGAWLVWHFDPYAGRAPYAGGESPHPVEK